MFYLAGLKVPNPNSWLVKRADGASFLNGLSQEKQRQAII